MHMSSATMAKFVENISASLDRPVTDNTQLEGLYSFTLNWVGLKLEPVKGPVEILVIDKAEKLPIEN
jgi:hypothetical protein